MIIVAIVAVAAFFLPIGIGIVFVAFGCLIVSGMFVHINIIISVIVVVVVA
jgi:hypothetical protein